MTGPVVTLRDDAIDVGARFAVAFMRTLRVPEDGADHPLPPGLGRLPLFRVDDHPDRLPTAWHGANSFFLPLYQREALWLSFRSAPWKPNALKVGAGGVNTITGMPHDERLRDDPQDYLVAPLQPWLDGFKTASGVIRQFVAEPLGAGRTVEAALTGDEHRGGIQLVAFEPRPGVFPDEAPPAEAGPLRPSASVGGMGLAAGGRIRQRVAPDPHGLDVWDQEQRASVTIHLLNSAQFRRTTGRDPPPTPIDARAYTSRGLPWFDLYDDGQGDLDTSPLLASLDGDHAEEALGVPDDQVTVIRRRPHAHDGPAGTPTTET